MKPILIATLCFLISCSAKQKQESGRGNNPYYSKSDTTHLNVSNAEWKKILSAELYNVSRENGTERGTKIQSEHITAQCAEINFSDPIQNLKVIAVGRVFLNHSEKTV